MIDPAGRPSFLLDDKKEGKEASAWALREDQPGSQWRAKVAPHTVRGSSKRAPQASRSEHSSLSFARTGRQSTVDVVGGPKPGSMPEARRRSILRVAWRGASMLPRYLARNNSEQSMDAGETQEALNVGDCMKPNRRRKRDTRPARFDRQLSAHVSSPDEGSSDLLPTFGAQAKSGALPGGQRNGGAGGTSEAAVGLDPLYQYDNLDRVLGTTRGSNVMIASTPRKPGWVWARPMPSVVLPIVSW